MSDDLVSRLRDIGDHAGFEPHMHHTAANRIEELEKQADTFADGWQEERLKMIDAEDKLATAVVALETLCQLVDEQCADRLYTQSVVGWEHFADHVGDIARATLAELKEKTDE